MANKNIKTAEKTWDTIAESFDTTRKKPWQQCIDFIDDLHPSSVVADLGCGNGRHLLPCAEHGHHVIGLDISTNLLHIVQDKVHEKHLDNVLLLHGTLGHLPLKEYSVEAIIYVASLHNIQGREERIRSLEEVRRILTQDGKALISVWSRWQKRYRKYFFKQFFLRIGEFGDITIYWRQHGLNTPRFYHLYSKRELLKDLQDAGFIIEQIQSVKLSSKRSADNYFAVVRKQ